MCHGRINLLSAVPIVYPSVNQYVASNSMDILNYTCTVETGNKAIWEVGRVQYIAQSQLTQQSGSSGIGLTIIPTLDMNSRVSTISISNITRGNLPVQCVAVPLFDLGAVKGREYLVVSFGKSKVRVLVCGICGIVTFPVTQAYHPHVICS